MIRERGIAAATSPSLLPEVCGYHRGGVTRYILLSFPLPLHWARGHWLKPWHEQKLLHRNLFLKGSCFSTHANFPIQSSFHVLETQLETSFLSFFCLFNIKAKITVHIKSFYPSLLSKEPKAAAKGLKTLAKEFLWFINPLFAITPAGSALIVLRSSPSWISSSKKWSVVEPTWLPSSNYWKPMFTEMKLKYQY